MDNNGIIHTTDIAGLYYNTSIVTLHRWNYCTNEGKCTCICEVYTPSTDTLQYINKLLL